MTTVAATTRPVAERAASRSAGQGVSHASPARPSHPAGGHHQRAAHQALKSNSTQLNFHLAGASVELTLPPLDKLAFYAGLGGAAAFGLIEWPIAVLTGIGHLLSDDRRSRTLRALGEALDAL